MKTRGLGNAIASRCRWVAWSTDKMNRSRNTFCILGSVLCMSGCVVEGDSLDELGRLCEKDAGVRIYRSVAASGYYNASIPGPSLLDLIKSDFDFIEFCEDDRLRLRILDAPGCGRMTRVLRDSGRCHPRLQEILDESFPKPYVLFREQYCIALEQTEMPQARYFFSTAIDEWIAADGIGQLRKSRSWVGERNASEVLGEYITYSLLPRPTSMVNIYCDDIDDNYPNFVEADLINKALAKSSK